MKDEGLAYVIVTSPEAAKVFLGGWKAGGKPSVRVACVGKATGEVLEDDGIAPVFTPSKATGATLAAEIPLPSSSPMTNDESQEHTGRPRVLYVASARAQKTIEQDMAARGFDVRRLNTYDTVPAQWSAEAHAAAAGVSVAAFGSPSAVKTWVSKMEATQDRGNGALAACIGETSAEACRGAGWPETAIFYPDKPGIEGWVEAVSEALAAAQSRSGAGTTGAATA